MKPSNSLTGIAQAESPITVACNSLLKSINACDNDLDLLITRLAPVRIPTPDRNPSVDIASDRMACDLAANIYHMADLIDKLQRRISDLRSELQV